jgi:hypothetical protein
VRHAPSIRNSIDMQAGQDFLYFQRLSISDGTIEALKWLALIAMTCSHINYVLFPSNHLPALIEFGCIAFPLFGFVLAYNLARPNALQRGAYQRAIIKMLVFGVIATPFYVMAFPALVKHWLPLNIMFTLMLAVGIIWLLEKGGRTDLLLACVLFFVAGIFVSGHWFCVGYCLAAWCFCKKTNIITAFVWLISAAGLVFAYPGYWGMLAIPIIFITILSESKMLGEIKLPRLRSAFYLYYPAHLMVLLLIKQLMEAS